jgi:ornithine carbamoyltransferase
MITPTATSPHHLLRVSDLSAVDLNRVLDLAAEMKADPLGWRDAQAGKVLACYFSKPSTRTRVSLEAAAHRLGMLPLMLRPDELQLGRGEPIADTGRVLSSYVDAITIRTFAQSDVEELAAAATVPVINALTDEHHPCQALADLLTIREHFGELEGVRIAYLGDGNNVAHSLMEAGALAGMEVVVSTPYGYRPHSEIEIATRATLEPDPFEAVRGAQVVYTDVWVSMGEETQRAVRLDALAEHQVSSAIMDAASHDALFMHCLPAHRGEEVTAEVIDGARSVVFQQAANRLPTEQALIHTLIERWR